MEQRVELKTHTMFRLTDEELKRLYTALALYHYEHQRTPDYKEDCIVRRLRNDFYRFHKEIIKIRASDPNNLVLSQIQNFIQQHYCRLNSIVKE